jgi:hypothetical protein
LYLCACTFFSFIISSKVSAEAPMLEVSP